MGEGVGEGVAEGSLICLSLFSSSSPIGQWEDGMKQGEGKMTFFEGREYDGMWFRDRCHGKGKMTWSSGALLSYDVCVFFVVVVVVVFLNYKFRENGGEERDTEVGFFLFVMEQQFLAPGKGSFSFLFFPFLPFLLARL